MQSARPILHLEKPLKTLPIDFQDASINDAYIKATLSLLALWFAGTWGLDITCLGYQWPVWSVSQHTLHWWHSGQVTILVPGHRISANQWCVWVVSAPSEGWLGGAALESLIWCNARAGHWLGPGIKWFIQPGSGGMGHYRDTGLSTYTHLYPGYAEARLLSSIEHSRYIFKNDF